MAKNSFTLLVVDDDRRLRELLEKYLLEQGFWVITASNAQEAREMLEQENIDLIVLDWMMPEETGIEFLEKWRGNISHIQHDIPILMLTALGDVQNRVKGLEAGADDYLSKPFEPKELILRIQKILARVYKNGPSSTLK